MCALPPPPVEYAPLRVSQLLDPIKLSSPRTAGGGPVSLPGSRLNLLAAHAGRLYLAASDDSVFAYAVRRANGLSIDPVATFPIVPPTPINNIRVAHFSARHGGPALLLAGGDALAHATHGSMSVLRLPHQFPDDDDVDDDDIDIPGSQSTRAAETFFLTGLKSAWGLCADAASGRVALSTNSHCAVVLRMPEVDADGNFPLLALPPLAGTHFGNIPCVAFSRTGHLLASASIDTTFAVFDVHPTRLTSRRMLQSPQRNPHDDFPAEWCWAFTWISPRTPRPLFARDPAWPALIAHRTSPAARPLIAVLRDAPLVGAAAAAAAAAARISQSHLHGGGKLTRKRRRAQTPRPPPPTPPLYDDADGCAGPLKPLRTMRRAPAGQVHLPCTECGVRKTLASPTAEFTPPRRVRTEGATWTTPREPEDSLFVVARESSLSLHRMVGRGASVELDRVDPFVERRGTDARLSEVVEVPELSALLVTQQYGGGIAVVRIVRRATADGEVEDQQAEAHERIRYMLVVEGVIGGNRSGWIAGSCVVKKEVDGVPPVFEVFIVRADSTIEAFEISRRPCPMTAAWALCV